MPMPLVPKPGARMARYAATRARRHAMVASTIVQETTAWEDPDGGTRGTMDAYSPPNTYNSELLNLRLQATELLKSAQLLCHALGVRPEPNEHEASALLSALATHTAETGDQLMAAELRDADFQRRFGQRMGWVEPS